MIGFGDNILASGMARGAAARGKRIAFGDRTSIIWDHNSAEIFQYNPNIAPPGSEGSRDIEWVEFYRGNRIYNSYDADNKRWIWNYDFRPIPGEITFSQQELLYASQFGSGFILIEPHVPKWKVGVINKQWPVGNYTQIAGIFSNRHREVCQFRYGMGGSQIPFTRKIVVANFRQALAVLARAALYVGPEGGLHHAAAALGVPAVVIFGGWVPPEVLGYEMHTNLSYGKACGLLTPCLHCADAMNHITVRMVHDAIKQELRKQEQATNVVTASDSHMDLGRQI